MHPPDIKKAAEGKSESEKVVAILSNIEEVRRQKIDHTKTVTKLESDAIVCFKKAEKCNPESIRAEVTKGNSMMKAAGTKRKLIDNLDAEITNLTKEVQTLKKAKK